MIGRADAARDRRDPLRGRIARRVRLARWALAWERFWPALWPAPFLVGLFLALALFDVLPRLGAWIHLAVLVLLGFGFLFSVWRAARRFAWPSAAEATRRVERASGLQHRPLSGLDDRPVAEPGRTDPNAAGLWAVHQRRLRAALNRLRAGPPRSDLPRRDPIALRAAAALAVFVGVVIAWDGAGERIARAVTPGVGGRVAVPATVDLWVEPPTYTGLAPLYARTDRADLSFPAGSTVVARVGGGSGVPRLILDDKATPFAAAGEGSYEISTVVNGGARLAVAQGGGELAAWELSVAPDQPPVVALPREPSQTQRFALRIDYEAQDDYGLAKLTAQLRPLDTEGKPRADAPLELAMPVAGGPGAKRITGSAYNDLTAHPWAGEPVELRVVGIDGAGQTGTSEAVRFRLPEREFTHPIARAIVDERKKLAPDRETRLAVSRTLGAIAQLGDMFDHDVVVYLALSSAKWRLRHGEDGEEAVSAVRDLLWDTALRLEDGNLSIAERELRDAQKALLDALQRDATDAEIDKLIDRLMAALDRFMQSMAQQPEEMGEPQPVDENARMVSREDLQRMLERMREMAKSGSREAAMQMLAQLQEMLENLRRMQAGQQQNQAGQQMQQMMRDLQDLVERQRGVMDKTFRNAQQRRGQQPGQRGQQGQQGQRGQPQPGQPGDQQGGEEGEGMDGLAGDQEALRRMLGELMRQMGEQAGQIPNAFGRAERAMRDAVDSLQQGEPGEAVPSQSEALDQLQQAGRALAREMARQQGMPGQQGQQPQPGTPDMSMDPLGRPPGGLGADTRDVVIPDEGEMQRARRIRDELHRRSGDRARPIFEREYIDRLLERF